MLSHEDLLNLLNYCPLTGIFTWKVARYGTEIGAITGCDDGAGYLQIGVKGKVYRAHRLALFYVNGEWPKGKVDHANGVRNDNRLVNLRCADDHQNSANRGKVRGVSLVKRSGKWAARIQIKGKSYHLGCFEDIELASLVAREARSKYFNEFYREEGHEIDKR